MSGRKKFIRNPYYIEDIKSVMPATEPPKSFWSAEPSHKEQELLREKRELIEACQKVIKWWNDESYMKTDIPIYNLQTLLERLS